MLFLDLLMAAFIVLALTFGTERLSLWQFVAVLALMGLGLVAFHMGCTWLLDRLFTSPQQRDQFRRSVRRRIFRTKGMRSANESLLDEMNEEQLRAHIEKKPRDAIAVEILCERLLKEGRLADYAREAQYLLTITKDMTIEEQCSLYDRLADIYLNLLDRPDRAREMLTAITTRFPKHYQAALARQRLAQMGDATLVSQLPRLRQWKDQLASNMLFLSIEDAGPVLEPNNEPIGTL